MKYIVKIAEVHYSTREVDASSPEEAKEKAAEADEVSCDYAFSLDPENWIVEPAEETQANV